MNKGLDALKENRKLVLFNSASDRVKYSDNADIIEKALKTLMEIEESLKYGYVFIGYDKDNEPLFQFADTKLYEEIRKNMTY